MLFNFSLSDYGFVSLQHSRYHSVKTVPDFLSKLTNAFINCTILRHSNSPSHRSWMLIPPKRKGSMSISPQQFDHFLVLDFEATCERDTKLRPQEIIEFPCLKVNLGDRYSSTNPGFFCKTYSLH